VGTFAASPSDYGTYDQGGNVWQWNESIIAGSCRGKLGASFIDIYYNLASAYRNYDYPTDADYNIGFRVSQVPEPASFVILGLGVIGTLVRRRGLQR
jgi:formylglycine-generating enzyme required for sulfatase activity